MKSERECDMYGSITKYMGTAYTGLGISHKYDELIASADETVFLKCPPTTCTINTLKQHRHALCKTWF